ncbi:MAG: hypothetical protein GXP45_00210 [bacterium]|nr:hypothetical protein [bacterium]
MYYKILGKLARVYLQKHQAKVIGIHGSVGKTSCRTIIYQTLQHFLPNKDIYSSPKNFNGEYGMSLSIFQIEQADPNLFSLCKNLCIALYKRFFGSRPYDIVLLEYGIDRPGEMDFLLSIVKPHIGIITKLDAVHSMQFGSPEAIAKEEIKMLKSTLEIVFLNEEEEYAMQIQKDISVDSLSYQSKEGTSRADIQVQEKSLIWKESEVQVELLVQSKGKKHELTTNLLGYAHYGYIALALTIADMLYYQYYQEELNLSKSHQVVLNYQLIPGRFQFFQGKYDLILLDSSYNASPLSMRKTIDSLYHIHQKLFHKHKIWMMLGEMRELG